MICCELARLESHLLGVGCYGMDAGAVTMFLLTFTEREKIYNLLESLTGGRLTTNYTRIGGLARDLPPGWVEQCRQFLKEVVIDIDETDKMLTGNRIFIGRTKDVGVIPRDVAIDYGMTPALLTFAVIPFGSSIGEQKMVIADLNVGILYTFGIVSLGVYGIVLAGYASNSKYPFLGGIRSSAQLISYEIAMSPLTIIFCLPLLAALLILAIPRNYRFLIRCVALLASLLSLATALYVFFQYDASPAVNGFHFDQKVSWIQSLGIGFHGRVGQAD